MVISTFSWAARSSAWQSVHEKLFPNIQPKSWLEQLRAISSCPSSCYTGEKTKPHLVTTSLQVVVERNKVSESSVTTSISSLNSPGWTPSRPIKLCLCRGSQSLGLWDLHSTPHPCLPAQRTGYTARRYHPWYKILNDLCISKRISSTPHLQRWECQSQF